MTTRRALLGALVSPFRAMAPPVTLRRAEPEATEALVALLEPDLCVAYGGMDCRLCLTSCAVPGALLEIDGAPRIDASKCDGCGACVLACTTATSPPAISVAPADGATHPRNSLVEAPT